MVSIRFEGMSMEAKGHAGYAPMGADVVCAGMSTLFMTAAEMIRDMERRGMLAKKPMIRLEPGNVALTMEPWEDTQERAQAIWDYLETGCAIMAESYPPNVCIFVAEAAE